MAGIRIRNLDEVLKSLLRVRAARHGRSMEEEALAILRTALRPEPPQGLNLAGSIRRLVAPLGGVDLALPLREPRRQPPKLAK